MIKYKFLNGFIYCNGFRMLMTSVVEALNEMDGELSKGKEDYKNLFEAFEEGQKVLGDANKRLENLSRVNKEYKEVLTPIWDYCRENVKVEPGKSMTEALIESNKELVTKVARLERERDEDLMKLQGLGFECHNLKEQLAKANERGAGLEKELSRKASAFNYIDNHASNMTRRLANVEEQLAKANECCAGLEQDAKNNELVHVGFTNGDQITYAKTEEGSFYPDTAGDCYIPIYMLKSHEHRIETTSAEQLRKGGE